MLLRARHLRAPFVSCALGQGANPPPFPLPQPCKELLSVCGESRWTWPRLGMGPPPTPVPETARSLRSGPHFQGRPEWSSQATLGLFLLLLTVQNRWSSAGYNTDLLGASEPTLAPPVALATQLARVGGHPFPRTVRLGPVPLLRSAGRPWPRGGL